MEEKELAESIAKAIDFNLSQIFNEIDLKVKNITHINAEAVNALNPAKQETKIFVFSEINSQEIKSKIVISFSKENALKMVDLIKGAAFGSTKLLTSQEINSLKEVSLNLCKACVNSMNSIANTSMAVGQPDVCFSFSSFENEFVVGSLKGEGRLFELTLIVGGTDIKGELKFFMPLGAIK